MARISEKLIERLEVERDELRMRVTVLEAQLAEAKERVDSLCDTLGVRPWGGDIDDGWK